MITTSEMRDIAKMCGIKGYESMSRKHLFESLEMIRLYYTHTIINLKTQKKSHFGSLKEMAEFTGLTSKEVKKIMTKCIMFSVNGEPHIITPYL